MVRTQLQQVWPHTATAAHRDGSLAHWASTTQARTGTPVTPESFARMVTDAPACQKLRWAMVDVLAEATADGNQHATIALAVILTRVFPDRSNSPDSCDDLVDALSIVLDGTFRAGAGYRGLADGRRRRHRHENRAAIPIDPNDIPPPATSGFEDRVVEQLHARDQVEQVLARISPRDRPLIWHRLALGVPEDVVAEEHGVSPATVRRRVAVIRRTPPIDNPDETAHAA